MCKCLIQVGSSKTNLRIRHITEDSLGHPLAFPLTSPNNHADTILFDLGLSWNKATPRCYAFPDAPNVIGLTA